MAIVLNGSTGITAPDIDVTAQASDITTTGDITAVDVTLSGGVYLGGTGSANKLDDYEEGTWTPTELSGSGITLTPNTTNWYAKVGDLVSVGFDFTFSSNSSSSAILISLPFAALANSRSGGIIHWANTGTNDTIHLAPNYFNITYNGNSNRPCSFYSGKRAIGVLTYRAA
jgi:hypothetical protein